MIYRFKTIPIKIPATFPVETDLKNLHANTRDKIAKTIFGKERTKL